MKLHCIFILIFGFIGYHSIACICTSGTYRFIDHIARYQFVGMVEVIGKDTIKVERNEYTFTKVKILAQYHGRYIGQEIKIIDSKGFECFTRLWNDQLGSKFIIKGFIETVNDYVYEEDRKVNDSILVLSLCDINQLFVKDNIVIGHITKNNPHASWKWNRLLKKISFSLIDRTTKRKKSTKLEYQTMPYESFVQLINTYL